MASKLDGELNRLAKAEPERLVPVIVTLKPGADTKALQAKGLRIKQQLPLISGVSGTLTARDALAVAGLDDVIAVEFDGQMHALDQ